MQSSYPLEEQWISNGRGADGINLLANTVSLLQRFIRNQRGIVGARSLFVQLQVQSEVGSGVLVNSQRLNRQLWTQIHIHSCHWQSAFVCTKTK